MCGFISQWKENVHHYWSVEGKLAQLLVGEKDQHPIIFRFFLTLRPEIKPPTFFKLLFSPQISLHPPPHPLLFYLQTSDQLPPLPSFTTLSDQHGTSIHSEGVYSQTSLVALCRVLFLSHD